MGGGGGQQINNADSMYQQEAANSNQLMQQFMALYYPEIQKLMPELQGTLDGTNSTLMTAAQAPVNAETQRLLSSIGNNPGAVVNPNALYSDIALQGQQQAGLAGDQMLTTALSALQNLIHMGYGSVDTAQNSLNNAAGGEGNLGLSLNQQQNQLWESIIGAAGTAAGMAGGNPAAAASLARGNSGGGPSPLSFNPGMGMWGVGPGFMGNSLTPNGTTTNASTPISSTNNSYVQPPQNPNTFGG